MSKLDLVKMLVWVLPRGPRRRDSRGLTWRNHHVPASTAGAWRTPPKDCNRGDAAARAVIGPLTKTQRRTTTGSHLRWSVCVVVASTWNHSQPFSPCWAVLQLCSFFTAAFILIKLLYPITQGSVHQPGIYSHCSPWIYLVFGKDQNQYFILKQK